MSRPRRHRVFIVNGPTHWRGKQGLLEFIDGEEAVVEVEDTEGKWRLRMPLCYIDLPKEDEPQ